MVGTPLLADRALEGCPLLAGIPPDDLRRSCPTARIVTVQHRGTIYRQGDPGRTVFFVLDGQVTIARHNSDGATLTTAALGPGEFFRPRAQRRPGRRRHGAGEGGSDHLAGVTR